MLIPKLMHQKEVPTSRPSEIRKTHNIRWILTEQSACFKWIQAIQQINKHEPEYNFM